MKVTRMHLLVMETPRSAMNEGSGSEADRPLQLSRKGWGQGRQGEGRVDERD